MTMPTIEARTRHAHRVNGKFAPRPDSAVTRLDTPPIAGDKGGPLGWRTDSAMQAAARMQRTMSVDMPPMPEPIERETWRDVWADVRGVVLCAAFVLTVLAFGSHVAGFWGQ